MLRALLVSTVLFFSNSAFADIQDRINDCQAQGGGTCVFNLLRELAALQPGGPSRLGVCSVSDSSYIYYQIAGRRGLSLECYYNDTSFSSASTYDANTGRYSCSAWERGNPGYRIRLRLDGVDYQTNENDALANPCF